MFNPDYAKCTKVQKEIYFDLCKQGFKNNIVMCSITSKPCEAWQGYKHCDNEVFNIGEIK